MRHESSRLVRMGELLVVVFLLALPAGTWAQQAPSLDATAQTDAYARWYGEGFQHYIEGHYERAIPAFFRAWALRKDPHVLSMIVRSYDFQGHCDAARRQRDWLSAEFPSHRLPGLQRCARAGTLRLRCEPKVFVLIDNVIETRCGQDISLPAGEHRVEIPRYQVEEQVRIAAGATIERVFRIKPQKWTRGGSRPSPGLESAGLHSQDARRMWTLQSPNGGYVVLFPTTNVPSLPPRPSAEACPSPSGEGSDDSEQTLRIMEDDTLLLLP